MATNWVRCGAKSSARFVILLDLFCGRWGWSRAFAKRGWHCIGVDLTEPPEIPAGCEFVGIDVLNLRTCNGKIHFAMFENDVFCGNWTCRPDAIVASPPCEEFSVHGMKHFHPHPKYPENGIRLFNHTRQLCESAGVTYVMENVRAAQQFVGDAVHHCGPFYLWGNAVPPLLNQGIKKKDHFRMMPGNEREKIIRAGGDLKIQRNKWQRIRETTEYYGLTGTRRTWSGSKARAEMTARTATIPPDLANCVADYFERILETRAEKT